MYVGTGGFDATTLQRMTADDVARQESRGLIPRFFIETRGRENGTFFDIEMVEILVPGDAKSGPIRIVDVAVMKRFADQYKNWKAGLSQNVQGTPIELMVGNGSAMHQFKANNLHTVEQLAAVTDGALDHLGTGARELRDRAQRIIASQKTIREQQDADDDKRRIASLEKEIQEMRALMRAPEAAIVTHERMQPAPVPLNGDVPEGAAPVTSDRPQPRIRGGGHKTEA